MRSTRRKFTRALGLVSLSASLLGSRPVQTLSGNSNNTEITEAPTSKRAEVEVHLSSVLKKIPKEESERIALVDDASTKSCETVSDPSFDLDQVGPETTIADSTFGVLKNALTHINEVFETELPIKYLDEFSKLTKFVPLLSSLQNYIEVYCEIHTLDSPKQIGENLLEEYYIALGLIIVELVLLPSSVGYRTSFMGTRYVANAGLVRTRQIVGLRRYSVLLSVVHWGFRGSIEGAKTYIVERTAETVRELELEGLSRIEESDLDYEFLEEEEDSILDDILGDEEGKERFLDNWKGLDDIEAPSVETDDGRETDDDDWAPFDGWL